MKNGRAGVFIGQRFGVQTFLPADLPPNPPVQFDNEMLKLLSDADRKLGRLDGITAVLPNPKLFVAMYVKKEALLSAQIEGTQASFIDVLSSNEDDHHDIKPVHEVVDYIRAMEYGIERSKELPMSLRLLREIHGVLLENGRGSIRNPGEFRESQNWIGPSGSTLLTATFVPPAVPDMKRALSNLEIYFHDEAEKIPALIKIALIHAQFETIHPFLDGNGRMGRLLITFWLHQQKILAEPLLYLSHFLKENRTEYYDRLMDVRLKGEWEGWIKFFLRGVSFVADESVSSARQIVSLRERIHNIVKTANIKGARHGIRLVDLLFEGPVVTKTDISKILNISLPTASNLVNTFVDLEILRNLDPKRERGNRFVFAEYVGILERGTELV